MLLVKNYILSFLFFLISLSNLADALPNCQNVLNGTQCTTAVSNQTFTLDDATLTASTTTSAPMKTDDSLATPSPVSELKISNPASETQPITTTNLTTPTEITQNDISSTLTHSSRRNMRSLINSDGAPSSALLSDHLPAPVLAAAETNAEPFTEPPNTSNVEQNAASLNTEPQTGSNVERNTVQRNAERKAASSAAPLAKPNAEQQTGSNVERNAASSAESPAKPNAEPETDLNFEQNAAEQTIEGSAASSAESPANQNAEPQAGSNVERNTVEENVKSSETSLVEPPESNIQPNVESFAESIAIDSSILPNESADTVTDAHNPALDEVSSDFNGIIVSHGVKTTPNGTNGSDNSSSTSGSQSVPVIAVAGLTAQSDDSNGQESGTSQFKFANHGESNFIDSAASAMSLPIGFIIGVCVVLSILLLVSVFFIVRLLRKRYLNGNGNRDPEISNVKDNIKNAEYFSKEYVEICDEFSENQYYAESSPSARFSFLSLGEKMDKRSTFQSEFRSENNHPAISFPDVKHQNRVHSSATSYISNASNPNTSTRYERQLSFLSESSISSSRLPSFPRFK